MKEYRSAGGERRLWFEPGQIEEIMADDLRRAGMFPDGCEPVVDLEEFLELGLEVKLDIHARLESDVLGMTDFIRDKKPLVSISASLTSEAEEADVAPGLRGRWRATMAHEAAHVILHRMFIEVPFGQQDLFDAHRGARRSLLRCLKRDVAFGRASNDWKEVQANLGMAALLMPAEVFTDVVRVVASAGNSRNLLDHIPQVDSLEYRRFVVELSRRFQVSQQAAGIRLSTLGLVRGSGEPMLRDVVR